MTRLRQILATLLLPIGSALHAAPADTLSDEILHLASCQARYTAVLEHAWLMEGEVEAAAMRRDLFAAMLDALLLDDRDRHAKERLIVAHVVSQKHAAADLLETARFSPDERRARIALGLVLRQLASCDRLMIGRAPLGA